MTVFLTSSPVIPGTMDLNPANGFIQQLTAALPDVARTVFVSSDPDNLAAMEEFGTSMKTIIEKSGLRLEPFTILNRENEDDAKRLILEADFIILAGGHVPTQNAFFQEIKLADYIGQSQAVIMGISAGSMNAASVVYAQPEEEGEALDPNYQRYLDGLGLTEVMILPHYNLMKDAILDGLRVYEDITFGDSHGQTFYILPDGSYILNDGKTETLYGEAYLVKDGIMTPLQSDGQATVL